MPESRECLQEIQVSCMPITPTRIVPDIIEDVREGLLSKPRSLPPKYFYDERGSMLFANICETPEYYPTRTEEELLRKYSDDIINQVKPDEILELGSGTSRKTRCLFDACERNSHGCSYAPFDVCAPMLKMTAGQLQADYQWLTVTPLLGDYHAGLENLPGHEGRRLFVFIGSTIGNFTPGEARQFLSELHDRMLPGDFLLLGVDRVKDEAILNAAYNDKQGITADFNLNLLKILNRELGADFRLDNFSHHAGFNAENSRIEMRLVSRKSHTVRLGKINAEISFNQADDILTELSHKFTYAGAESLLTECGYSIINHYQPDNRYFSLILSKHTKY